MTENFSTVGRVPQQLQTTVMMACLCTAHGLNPLGKSHPHVTVEETEAAETGLRLLRAVAGPEASLLISDSVALSTARDAGVCVGKF